MFLIFSFHFQRGQAENQEKGCTITHTKKQITIKDINSKGLLTWKKGKLGVIWSGEYLMLPCSRLLCNSQRYHQLWIASVFIDFNTAAKPAGAAQFYKFAENSKCSRSVPRASHLISRPGFPHKAMVMGKRLMCKKDILI